MPDDPVSTCGEGLAAGGELPERMSQLLHARADVLERHPSALNADDPNGRREHARSGARLPTSDHGDAVPVWVRVGSVQLGLHHLVARHAQEHGV